MTHNAHRRAEDLAEELTKRFSEPFIVGVLNSDPTISSKRAFIVLTGERSPMPANAFGTPSDAYVAKVVQLVTQEGVGPADILPLLLPLARLDARIDWYQAPKGTVPTEAAITGGKTVASAFPSLYGSRGGW